MEARGAGYGKPVATRRAVARHAAGPLKPALPLLFALGLWACGDGGLHDRVEATVGRLEGAVERLGEQLDRGTLRNGALIRQYADKVAAAKPELRDLARVLEREATRQGTLYQGIATRVRDLRTTLPAPGAAQQEYAPVAEELDALADAVDPAEFNRALSDPLNVLADLSDGALPRVDATSMSASRNANRASDFGPGSQLVGNPNYGRWRTDSGGNSFWVWYGQFALIRDLLGGPRIGYGAWAGGRDYSYYHDYGRRNYTSPAGRQQQRQVESTARRKFASQNRAFRSPYDRRRQGASTSVQRQKFASTRTGATNRASSGRFGATTGRTTRPASVRGFGGGGFRGPRRGK